MGKHNNILLFRLEEEVRPDSSVAQRSQVVISSVQFQFCSQVVVSSVSVQFTGSY
jgi:hypothetical protein